MNGHIEYSTQHDEWIVVFDGVGYRHFFDCKAEAEEYLRLVTGLGYPGYVWRNLGEWCKQHKHDNNCFPYWKRVTHDYNHN